MKIEKSMNSFQMKWKTRKINNKECSDIILDNNKRLLIVSERTKDKKYYKLMSLYDSAGKWIKSKLQYFSNNKVYRELTNEKL